MDNSTDALINEVRIFYQSLVQVVTELHGDQISIGMRAVLEYLLKNGPVTVPTIARQRRVSRQRIQTLVNQLLNKSMVESTANPASKRSPLIALTSLGKQTIEDMRRKEGSIFKGTKVSQKRIEDACQVLMELRGEFESKSGSE